MRSFCCGFDLTEADLGRGTLTFIYHIILQAEQMPILNFRAKYLPQAIELSHRIRTALASSSRSTISNHERHHAQSGAETFEHLCIVESQV